MAVSSLAPSDVSTHLDTLHALAKDPDPPVRTATADQLGHGDHTAIPILADLGRDTEASVREAVATAYGQLGDRTTLPWLQTAATADDDRLVREAATAAIGAIGDPSGLETLLGLIKEAPPQVRRRAIAAVTVFDDPRIEPALRRAALDRNPSVREAAEMVVGRQISAMPRETQP